MAECGLCQDNEQVEIVVTLPGVSPVGTTTCSCPNCLAREKDAEIKRFRERATKQRLLVGGLQIKNAKLRAERDQLREACHVALDTVQWDHGREVYAKLVRALDSTEMNHG